MIFPSKNDDDDFEGNNVDDLDDDDNEVKPSDSERPDTNNRPSCSTQLGFTIIVNHKRITFNIIANYWAGMTASLENYFYCLYEGVNWDIQIEEKTAS